MINRIGRIAVLAAFLAAIWSTEAAAGKASVVHATVSLGTGDTFSFTATVKHADTGWEHYANKFEILSPDGKALDTRVLYHPHVDEQPFTRGSGSVKIPPGITSVIVRAWDNVHKAGEVTFTVKLPGR
ncbi:MAG: hypothetical protein O3B76_11035 [Proteobacteria bacterium]|nr:hypothetical protein [Pseudomonadota bacterium]MDA1023416.1 hypothetical protein [Pseudomonadota bacterium]